VLLTVVVYSFTAYVSEHIGKFVFSSNLTYAS